MNLKIKSIITVLVLLLPTSSFAQGIQQGIENFLFVSFGVVVPSIVLLALFFWSIYKKNIQKAPLIYSLGIYLAYTSLKYLFRYNYLYGRRSAMTRTDGSYPGLSDELTMIAGCILGLMAIAAILSVTLKKHLATKS
jgi:O-antigen/teichoic acid export membrane protein